LNSIQLKFNSGSDRYQFQNHVSYFNNDLKKSKDRRLYNDDMSTLTTQFDTNAEFTIIVTLYYGDYTKRTNGTIFMFSEGLRKFHVKESINGFVIRYFCF